MSKKDLSILDLFRLIKFGAASSSLLRNTSLYSRIEKLPLFIGMIKKLTSLLDLSMTLVRDSKRMIVSSVTLYITKKLQ